MTEEGARPDEVLDIEFLHEIGSRMAAADPFHALLERVVDFVSTIAMCDSCFVYVLEGEEAGAAELKKSARRPGG